MSILRRGIATLQQGVGVRHFTSDALLSGGAFRTSSIRRLGIAQARNGSSFPGKDRDDMGGPDGQEHFPASTGLRRYDFCI